ncbi:hypothetical protein HMPREF1992_00228 [Selenomonas sp. oral taxon 892 str. F0426]|nr:hypothetical protein HMPREF1992_00228 [Selenomonas sp. oral taxon 892 str. F0426]
MWSERNCPCGGSVLTFLHPVLSTDWQDFFKKNRINKNSIR